MRLAGSPLPVLRSMEVRRVDVDGLVLQEDVLVLVDGDDVRCFGELIDGAGVRDGDFDAGLQHRRGEHEDEQQHEDDVDQRRDVDLGQRGLGADCLRCEWRRPLLEGPPAGFFDYGCWLRLGCVAAAAAG